MVIAESPVFGQSSRAGIRFPDESNVSLPRERSGIYLGSDKSVGIVLCVSFDAAVIKVMSTAIAADGGIVMM